MLLLWKQRNGFKATYTRLINIFERAGYKSYADNIRRIVCVSDNEMDNSSSVIELPTITQPLTYSIYHPPSYSPPSSSLDDESTSCMEYELINLSGEILPKGTMFCTINYNNTCQNVCMADVIL